MKSLYNRITSRTTEFIRRSPGWLALALLSTMGVLALGSMIGNSAIVDELAHIPAAYSYLHFGDYRLNPEHPPLIKDLAGLPLQFLDLKFPDTLPAWTTAVNGQWDTGWSFIYHLGNNPDLLIFWARLPILLLGLTFGAVLYVLVKRRWGIAVALLTLFFYALSPNFLAHTTLVTTDLGASIFMFLALVAFVRFIERPSRANLVLLSVALAAAQLAKFSSFLLYPFLAILALALAWILRRPKNLPDRMKLYLGGLGLASILSGLWVWLVYAVQVINMPLAVQDRLIEGSLKADRIRFVADFLVNLNNWPLMKPVVQYILGLAMVVGRVAGGNVAYFNGQVSTQSFGWYFPELFTLKTQVAMLILMVAAVGLVAWRAARITPARWLARLTAHVRGHVLEWTLGTFAVFYFLTAVIGNLNLGIRHILPVYIPLFVLLALVTVKRWRELRGSRWAKPALGVFAVLMLWYGGSTVAAYPGYLSYFNEIIGGPQNADKYFSDSSVDWGQDLKRLKTYVDNHHEIKHIAVDYFGGGVPDYYFCLRSYDDAGQLITTPKGYDCSHSIYEEWHAQNGIYTGQYIAVSETFLENDRYYAKLYGQVGYGYLRARQPIAKVGNSIYIFKLY
jgi:hypothetical protein